MKIFWSWQSDTPGKIGRHFVRDALERALTELSQELAINDSDRPELDHDRKGISGSPDLAATIFKKIDECDVFIADVTPVGKNFDNKAYINPNVAIELGYALARVTDARLLMVLNEHYGGRDDLPFDLRQKAGPIIFKLAEGATNDEIKKVQLELTKDFKTALREYIKPKRTQNISDQHQEIPTSFSIAQYFPTGEVLAERERRENLNLRYIASTLVYLRLLPTRAMQPLRDAEIKDLVFGIKLRPLNPETPTSAYWGRNRFGGITYDFESDGNQGWIITSSQLFSNRELWGIDTTSLDLNDHVISTISFERVLTLGLRHYLQFATEKLSIECPITVEAGISNVERYRLALDGPTLWGPIYKRNIKARHTLTGTDEGVILRTLETLVSERYDAAGQRRPDKFGPIGNV